MRAFSSLLLNVSKLRPLALAWSWALALPCKLYLHSSKTQACSGLRPTLNDFSFLVYLVGCEQSFLIGTEKGMLGCSTIVGTRDSGLGTIISFSSGVQFLAGFGDSSLMKACRNSALAQDWVSVFGSQLLFKRCTLEYLSKYHWRRHVWDLAPLRWGFFFAFPMEASFRVSFIAGCQKLFKATVCWGLGPQPPASSTLSYNISMLGPWVFAGARFRAIAWEPAFGCVHCRMSIVLIVEACWSL